METSPSPEPVAASRGTACRSLVAVVFVLLAGCNETTGTAPSTVVQGIGEFIEDGDLVKGARHVWSLAEPRLDVAVASVEKAAGDAAGLVSTVSGLADSTLEQSVTGSRIGIDTGYREGALAGALAGSVAGLLSGPWVVRHHTSFLATRKLLDDEVAFQQEAALYLSLDITTTREVLALHRREIVRLGEASEESLADIRAWERALARIEADRRTLRAMIVGAERSIAVLEERIALFRTAGLDTSPLEGVGAVRQHEIDNLRAIEDALVALIADSPFGHITVSPSSQPDHLP